jgi:multidrug resistance protein
MTVAHIEMDGIMKDMAPTSDTISSPETAMESSISIYDIRTNRRRLVILVMLAMSGLVLPFSDSVYLPALASIEHDLNASTILVDYTISFYLIAAGIAGLVWGPLSDRYGRKIILLISFTLFLAFTIVCILARSIVVLLVFRSLQGAAISASFVVGQSAIVDMYPSAQLGFAMGLFLVPLLVGPIIGPLVGGVLSNFFGWRSTFISLGVLAVISISMIVLCVPETNHYRVLQQAQYSMTDKIDGKCKKKKIRIREADAIVKPRFLPPWQPFIFLSDLTITPHVAICNFNFATLFILFTLMSNQEADKPYSLSPFLIGLSYIPTGIGSLVGSIVGGWISDWSAKRFPRAIESRLLFNVLGSLLCPFGLLLCGWAYHFAAHLAIPLIGSALFCFGETFVFTGACAFATVKKPSMTGAVLALINSLSFISAGIGIIIVAPLLTVMQCGPLFSILSGISLILICISLTVIVYQMRRQNAGCISPDPFRKNAAGHILVEQPSNPTLIHWF